MGTKKLDHSVKTNLSIAKRYQTYSAKTLINSLTPNFRIKNSLGKLSIVPQAIV